MTTNPDDAILAENQAPRSPYAYPRTLVEVAELHLVDMEEGWTEIPEREFAFAFYTAPHEKRYGMIRDEPQLTGHDIFDAYIAGAAEEFAGLYELPVPEWTEGPKRFLDKPEFLIKACYTHKKLRDLLLSGTSRPYARRNVFAGSDPLGRVVKFHPPHMVDKKKCFAALRTKEPRVLLHFTYKGIKETADVAEEWLSRDYPHLIERVPRRGAIHDPYYLSMAINELKFRGGEKGWDAAMRLVDMLVAAQKRRVATRRHHNEAALTYAK
ncbi:MAG: hypothetical protein LBR22_04000 [Desulfovibrio sp.]|jgi:hypothetical protein|nr:hypothetical protein [Desulfovibrio sp.]